MSSAMSILDQLKDVLRSSGGMRCQRPMKVSSRCVRPLVGPCCATDRRALQVQPQTSWSDADHRSLFLQGIHGFLHILAVEFENGLSHQFGFWHRLPGLIRSFAETGEDLHLHFDSARRVAEAAVESAIARFQRTGSARRWDGTFFTT